MPFDKKLFTPEVRTGREEKINSVFFRRIIIFLSIYRRLKPVGGNLATHPDYQKRGYASAIMDTVFEEVSGLLLE